MGLLKSVMYVLQYAQYEWRLVSIQSQFIYSLVSDVYQFINCCICSIWKGNILQNFPKYFKQQLS